MSTSDGMETRYFLTDHLGSVRQVVAADGSVSEQNDYYPFGKTWKQLLHFFGERKRTVVPLPHYADLGVRFYNQ